MTESTREHWQALISKHVISRKENNVQWSDDFAYNLKINNSNSGISFNSAPFIEYIELMNSLDTYALPKPLFAGFIRLLSKLTANALSEIIGLGTIPAIGDKIEITESDDDQVSLGLRLEITERLFAPVSFMGDHMFVKYTMRLVYSDMQEIIADTEGGAEATTC